MEYITYHCDTMTEFKVKVAEFQRDLMSRESPLRITFARRDDKGTGIALFSYYHHRMQVMGAVDATFNVRWEELSDIMTPVNQSLLDSGKMITCSYVEGITHAIVIPMGAQGQYEHHFYAKMDRTTAVLTAIKYNARCEERKPCLWVTMPRKEECNSCPWEIACRDDDEFTV